MEPHLLVNDMVPYNIPSAQGRHNILKTKFTTPSELCQPASYPELSRYLPPSNRPLSEVEDWELWYHRQRKNIEDFTLPRTSAQSIATHKFEFQKWAVESVLPEGLTILAGAPKVGKSFFALQLALAVAKGEPFLGTFPVTGGPVTYFALEDSKRRLQDRLQRCWGGGETCPPLLRNLLDPEQKPA